MAVVLDTGAVSRGSGNQGSNKERDIRKAFVEADLIEAVVLLPENLFYNTTAPGIIMVLNPRKRHPGEILLINASKLFSKGRPKNFLEEQHIKQIGEVYHEWKAETACRRSSATEEVVKNDFNLSPSRYVATGEAEEVLPLEEAVVLLQEAEEERAEADRELDTGSGGTRVRGVAEWLNRGRGPNLAMRDRLPFKNDGKLLDLGAFARVSTRLGTAP